MRFKRLLPMICLVAGVIIGLLLGWYQHHNDITVSRGEADTSFRLDVLDENLTIVNVEWSEYPGWKNVSFDVHGTFTIQLPVGASIDFCDLENEESLKELQRTSYTTSADGTSISYDVVTYELTNGHVTATGIIKASDNPIASATSGYRVQVEYNTTQAYTLGYLPPDSTVYTPWSSLEQSYGDCDLSPYLSAYQLSRTYIDTSLQPGRTLRQDIAVSKAEDALLNCTITNQSDAAWSFRADLPSLELWYNGVWIEVLSPYDSALMTHTCDANDSYELAIPADINDRYPSLYPGIYRLVIYGTEEDYAVSDRFVVEYHHAFELLP